MSLNDHRWGRVTDEEPTDKDKKVTPENQEGDTDEPPLRADRQPSPPPEAEKKRPHNDGDGDLEDLWREFNDRLNGMLGRGSSSQKPPQPQANSTRPQGDDDFDEPPLRADRIQPEQPAGGSGGGRGSGPNFKIPAAATGGLLGLLALAALGFWLASGFYIVPEGQRGVVTTFGRYSETANPGFRWHVPYPVQAVELVDVSSVRKAEIGIRGGTQRLKEALMLTDDENIVDVTFSVQYRIKDGPGAEEFLFRTRDPMGAVVQTAESAMREVVGRKKMDSVLFESKQEIAEEVKRLMQEMLDRYHSGIQVLSVAIQNAQPPEQVQAAFNDAVKAGQDRERQINEGEAYANDVVPKARGMAERLRQEAEAYKSRVVSQAQGDSSRFAQVLQEYQHAPKVTRDRMYVDAMQQIYNGTSKVLVDSKSSGNLLYLPLDKLMEKSAAAPAALPATSAPAARPQSAAAAPEPAGSESARNTSRTLR